MHSLSIKYFDSHWALHLEYYLFLQLSGLRFDGFVSITKAEESRLRELAQAVWGWYIWDVNDALPRFKPWKTWDQEYQDWHLKNILFRNLKSSILCD